jgi:cytochrome c oxidase cbb3-type subunit III
MRGRASPVELLRSSALVLAIMLILGIARPVVPAQDTNESVDREMSSPLLRGATVYRTYCVLCHGERGDGVARARKLHRNLNLTITPRPRAFYERIVRKGGEAVGVSPFMPPWQDELSTDQIEAVLTFLNTIGDPVRRGEVVFKQNCLLCHGVQGDGRGRAAKLYDPRPADLTHSNKSDEYKEAIIRFGGAALHRSRGMPVWNQRLTESEIKDVVKYLRSIVTTRPLP